MTEFLDISEQLAAVAELDRLFLDQGLAYWLFGGWAVDFHVGRVTREHGDIDIAVWSADYPRLATLLVECAWRHCPEADDDGYTSYVRAGIRLEVAFLARDTFGHVYTPLRDGRGAWPADSFGSEVALLRGVSAHVVSRDSLITDKSTIRGDARTTAKDRADVTNLRHRE